LEAGQSLFGDAGVQTAISLIDGYRGVHILRHTLSNGKSCGKEIHERPGALWYSRTRLTAFNPYYHDAISVVNRRLRRKRFWQLNLE
jgi:hypothetical protein